MREKKKKTGRKKNLIISGVMYLWKGSIMSIQNTNHCECSEKEHKSDGNDHDEKAARCLVAKLNRKDYYCRVNLFHEADNNKESRRCLMPRITQTHVYVSNRYNKEIHICCHHKRKIMNHKEIQLFDDEKIYKLDKKISHTSTTVYVNVDTQAAKPVAVLVFAQYQWSRDLIKLQNLYEKFNGEKDIVTLGKNAESVSNLINVVDLIDSDDALNKVYTKYTTMNLFTDPNDNKCNWLYGDINKSSSSKYISHYEHGFLYKFCDHISKNKNITLNKLNIYIPLVQTNLHIEYLKQILSTTKVKSDDPYILIIKSMDLEGNDRNDEIFNSIQFQYPSLKLSFTMMPDKSKFKLDGVTIVSSDVNKIPISTIVQSLITL
jgi:hypothetical protein